MVAQLSSQFGIIQVVPTAGLWCELGDALHNGLSNLHPGSCCFCCRQKDHYARQPFHHQLLPLLVNLQPCDSAPPLDKYFTRDNHLVDKHDSLQTCRTKCIISTASSVHCFSGEHACSRKRCSGDVYEGSEECWVAHLAAASHTKIPEGCASRLCRLWNRHVHQQLLKRRLKGRVWRTAKPGRVGTHTLRHRVCQRGVRGSPRAYAPKES